jgi:hypothetical protein
MHIGFIGGIGPAATEFYYRGLIARHERSGTALDLTIVHADVYELTSNAAKGEPRKQAESFAKLIARLAAAGARVAAVTSMTGHFCIRELESISPLSLINAIPEIDAAIKRKNVKTVGILGTRTVMGTKTMAVYRPRQSRYRRATHSIKCTRTTLRWRLPAASHKRSETCSFRSVGVFARSKVPRRSCSAAPIFVWLLRTATADFR